MYIKENDRSAPLIETLDKMHIPNEKILSLSRFTNEQELNSLHRGNKTYRLTIGRDLLIPEVGAFIGHYKATQAFLESNAKFGIIFDDDARSLKDLTKLAITINVNQPCLISLCENIDGIPAFFQFNKNITRLHYPSTMTAHAYLLNRKAAIVLVSHFKRYGVTSVADWPYPLPRLKFYITRDPFFVQEVLEGEYSVGSERDHMRTEGTNHALTMPISVPELISRLLKLKSERFLDFQVIYHELILRLRVRRFLAIQKLKRLLRNAKLRNTLRASRTENP